MWNDNDVQLYIRRMPIREDWDQCLRWGWRRQLYTHRQRVTGVPDMRPCIFVAGLEVSVTGVARTWCGRIADSILDCMTLTFYIGAWLGSLVVRALDLRLDDGEFDSPTAAASIGSFIELPRPTQPPILSGMGNEYRPKCVDALRLGNKGMAHSLCG